MANRQDYCFCRCRTDFYIKRPFNLSECYSDKFSWRQGLLRHLISGIIWLWQPEGAWLITSQRLYPAYEKSIQPLADTDSYGPYFFGLYATSNSENKSRNRSSCLRAFDSSSSGRHPDYNHLSKSDHQYLGRLLWAVDQSDVYTSE